MDKILRLNMKMKLFSMEDISSEYSAFGRKIGIMSIGNTGERGYKNSTVQITDMEGHPSRAAARGGLGSLMGSKKIKAIVLDVKIKVPVEYDDTEKFKHGVKNYIAGIKANPISGQAMPALGTAVLVNGVNALGGLPTRNYSSGTFEKAEDISGENLAKIQSTRGGKNGHVCHPGCVIGCSNIYNDANGKDLTSGFEYETIGLAGSNCGIGNLEGFLETEQKQQENTWELKEYLQSRASPLQHTIREH